MWRMLTLLVLSGVILSCGGGGGGGGGKAAMTQVGGVVVAPNGQMAPTSVTPSQDMSISVFPNQTIFVEATVYDNKFVSLKRVDTVSDPNITMSFRFLSTDGGKSMTLRVKNPFDRNVKYNIDMVDFKGNLHHTSSCPLYREAFEMWPHPIPELRISNFRFLEPDEKTGCIY